MQGGPVGQGGSGGHDRIKPIPVPRTPPAENGVRRAELTSGRAASVNAKAQNQALSPLSSIALGQWYRAEQDATPAMISALHCQQLGQYLIAQTMPEAKPALEVVQALWLVQREIHLIKSGLMSP
ncbi:hypothetical protein L4D08_22635 [Photobacterium chitinilyticum]